MLEGLEAVEMRLNDCQSVIDFRIDASTYKKEYIISDKLIRSKKHSTIEKLSISVKNFGAYSLCNLINFTETGVPFLMTGNIRHNFIDWNNQKYIDNKSHEILIKSHCKKGQVLVTMAGEYLGRVAVYDKNFICSSNQAIAKITLKKDENPYVVSTFLNTKYGQNQINRFKTITGQPNINMSLIKDLILPTFSSKFSKIIENIVKKSEKQRELSKQTYAQAEGILLFEIGLGVLSPEMVNSYQTILSEKLDAPQFNDAINESSKIKPDNLDEALYLTEEIEQLLKHENYSPDNYILLKEIKEQVIDKLAAAKNENDFLNHILHKLKKHVDNHYNIVNLQKEQKQQYNIKSLSESFLSSGRLDAEYYQKKYDELELRITSQNYVRIKDIRSDNFRGLQPIYFENGDLDVINSKHILDNTLDYDNFEKTNIEYWEKQEKARVYKGDILTYTTGANIGRTQVYLKQSKALASNHVNIIRLKQENPFYIGFVLNSIVGRLQTEKRSAGSAQAELYPKDLDEFLIPIINPKKQQKIAELVEESFKLKAESERLLEVAKKAVEMAIEVNEETAMKFINKKMQ